MIWLRRLLKNGLPATTIPAARNSSRRDEGLFYIAFSSGIDDMNLSADRAGRSLHLVHLSGRLGKVWIEQYGKYCGLRQ